MHDIAEGVVPNILELILTTISETYKLDPSVNGRGWKSASRTVIEKKFLNYHSYYEGSPCVKFVKEKSKFKVYGTALQVLHF